MRKILEDLYFGNIVPCEKRIAADAERLNEEERQTLDTLIGTHHEINSITAKEYFILGFRLGVRLMVECMDEDDGELIDRG